MPRYSVQTNKSPEEIIQQAVVFFGQGGIGLEMTARSPCCAQFEGGGGHVSVNVNEGAKTEVELVTREWDWDYAAKRFVRQIGLGARTVVDPGFAR
jgi:hypothetical protein